MIGDKLVFLKEHTQKAKKILKYFLKDYKAGAKYIITIGGEAGTGKTEIAVRLRGLFYDNDIKSLIINTDDYYKTKWSERQEVRERTNIIGKKEIDWDKLNSVVTATKTEFYSSLITQKINKYTDSIEKHIIDNDHIDVVIVEGLYALFLKNVDLHVFLKETYRQTQKFRARRNKEPQSSFRNKVLLKEQKDVQKTKKYADLII